MGQCDNLVADLTPTNVTVTMSTDPCYDVAIVQTDVTLNAITLAGQGPKGDAATCDAGTATSLPSTSPPTVTNSGTSSAAIFNFGIPVGSTGPAGPPGQDSLVPGPQGPAGPAGPTGSQGPQGSQGAPGSIGPAGPTGPVGPTGPAGSQGNPGPTGATGPQGPAGNTGSAGPAGPQGSIGPAGPQGTTGPTGTPAWTLNTISFTVPNVGSTVVVTVQDASWVAVGEIVYVQDAGGPGLAAPLRVNAKSGNQLTLLNPAVGSALTEIKPVSWMAGSNPNNATLFVADRALTIASVTGVVEAANGAAATVSVMKAASGTALSAGTVIHSGSFNANGAAAVYQNLTLTVGSMAQGDRLGLVTTGIFTNSVGSLSVSVQ